MTDELQRRVLREAGIPSPRLGAALFLLRSAASLFPHDTDLCGPSAISLYVRHNRARRGTLREGDAAPDVPLYQLDGSRTSVISACNGAPTLLVAGSFT